MRPELKRRRSEATQAEDARDESRGKLNLAYGAFLSSPASTELLVKLHAAAAVHHACALEVKRSYEALIEARERKEES